MVNSLQCANANALVISAGSLQVNATSEFDGGLTLSGGDLIASGALTLAGNTSWQTGTISGNGLINSGAITLSGTVDKTSAGTFNNNNSIIVTGTGNLVVNATFNNNSQGVIDFQDDGGIAGDGAINNSGIIKKSAGTGVSSIGPSSNSNLYFNQLAGTLDAQSGTLQLNQVRTDAAETGGTWDAETGATLEFIGSPNYTEFGGNFSGSGGGTVQLNSGPFYIDYPGATFNFPTGLLQWVGGSISGNTLTNSGSITLASSADKALNTTLNNNGTLIEIDTGNLVVNNTLNNNATGMIDFQDDAGIAGGGSIENSGTIQKSAGTGVSSIGPSPSSSLYFDQAGR